MTGGTSHFASFLMAGSRVHIYFPGRDEAEAIAVYTISMGGGSGRNPADKSFSTPSGLAMNMKQGEYSFDVVLSSLSIGKDGVLTAPWEIGPVHHAHQVLGEGENRAVEDPNDGTGKPEPCRR